MRIGFHSVALHKFPIERAINMVAAADYDAIELNAETLPWAAPHVTPGTSLRDIEAIRRGCGDAGITISAISAHIPMLHAMPEKRRTALAYVNGCTDLAARVGAPVIHILSGPAPRGVAREEAWKWFRFAVAEAAAHAQNTGITLAVEAIAGHLFHCKADYERLIAELPDVVFKINFDPSHLIVQGENPADLVEALASRIAHVHIKDGAGRFPNSTFPPLGKGTIAFESLIKRLEALGYDGTLSVEYEANTFGFTADEDDILTSCRAFLRRLGYAKAS